MSEVRGVCHPAPRKAANVGYLLIAKSDGHQGLFAEQLHALVKASRATWNLRRELDKAYLPSASLDIAYKDRMSADRKRFFGK